MLVLAFAALALQSASPEANDLFEKQVRPVLARRCHSCHGASRQFGNLRLDTRDNALKGGSRGPSVIAGNAPKSIANRCEAGGRSQDAPRRACHSCGNRRHPRTLDRCRCAVACRYRRQAYSQPKALGLRTGPHRRNPGSAQHYSPRRPFPPPSPLQRWRLPRPTGRPRHSRPPRFPCPSRIATLTRPGRRFPS